jgi:hypothetical protein
VREVSNIVNRTVIKGFLSTLLLVIYDKNIQFRYLVSDLWNLNIRLDYGRITIRLIFSLQNVASSCSIVECNIL